MAQQAGRVVCPRCGSNNFDTVTACWKCSTPLGAAAPSGYSSAPAGYIPSPIANPVSTPNPPPFNPQQPFSGQASPQPTYAPPQTEAFAYRAATAAYSAINTARSNRAAFWLGISMPYFGFPIGLAFMMCDDPRRQEVGRICILWSLVSGVVHFLLMFVSLLGMRELAATFLGAAKAGLNSRGGGSGGGFGGEP